MGRKLIDSEKDAIRKLYLESDLSLEEVAKVFKVCSKTVFRVLHFQQCSPYPEHLTREESIAKYNENHPNRHKEYYYKNKDIINKKASERQKRKRAENPQYRLKANLRSRISHAIRGKGGYKSANTEKLLGCTISELRDYLESKFQDGMTWDNYGKWHIDHIIPCDAFDLTIKEEQEKCFHYTNLQPLWAKDNIAKSNKVLTSEQNC